MVIANRISSVNFFKRINATKSSIAVMAIAMLLTAFACRETVGQEKVPDQPIAQETLVPGVSSLPQENTADSSEGTTPAVAPGAIGKQDGVVTHELDHSRKEETSYEQMLLARPMPMSKAERDFVFSHKAPESIRSWSLDEFQNYVDTTIGASDMMSEGLRWLGVRRMLRHQSKFMSEFLSGRSTGAEKESSRKGNPNVPPAFDREFLVDESVFGSSKIGDTFERLKACRQDIADLCTDITSLKRQARKRGRLQRMEDTMNAMSWDE